jgi:hypothetical protein
MTDRESLESKRKANEAGLNRLHSMSPAILLAAHFDLIQLWPISAALVIGLGLIWLVRRGKRD